MVDFEGTALQMRGVNFKATLTRISDWAFFGRVRITVTSASATKAEAT